MFLHILSAFTYLCADLYATYPGVKTIPAFNSLLALANFYKGLSSKYFRLHWPHMVSMAATELYKSSVYAMHKQIGVAAFQ